MLRLMQAVLGHHSSALLWASKGPVVCHDSWNVRDVWQAQFQLSDLVVPVSMVVLVSMVLTSLTFHTPSSSSAVLEA